MLSKQLNNLLRFQKFKRNKPLFQFTKYNSTNQYDLHYQASIDPETREQYWMEQAQMLDWHKKPQIVLDKSHPNPGFWRWFPDGEFNITYNALDRHLATRGDQAAYFYNSPLTGVQETWTYNKVYTEVCKLATILKEQGIEKGDRVIIYMPLIPEALCMMLACTRIGAIHSVVFGGFASQELANRIIDCEPKLILSASCGIEPGNKIIKYKDLLDKATKISNFKGKVIVKQREIYKTEHMNAANDYDYDDLMKNTTELAEAVPMKGSDIHYLLYTSGTTGHPKGVVRDTVGTALASAYSMKHIWNVQEGETFFAASDIGWVVGHVFICYGPLISGSSSVLFEGKPVGTPDASIYWQMVEKYKVKGLFTAPTAIRAIRKEDPELNFIKDYDVSSLQAIHIAGERLDRNTADWIQQKIDPIKVNDNYWQTETGWPISSNFLGLQWFDNVPNGSAGKPVPGYDIKIMNDHNEQLTTPNALGKICIKLPMPISFIQTIWKQDQQYIDKYLTQCPGYYEVGDSGYFDDKGCLNIMTRLDDVINTAGHRLSTGALEESLLHHDLIVEAAVVGKDDDLKTEIPFGFAVIQSDTEFDVDQMEKECIKLVREYIGPVAAFKHCIFIPKLPKTRSGKVLRHILYKMVNGIKIDQIPPTIEDATILDKIQEKIEKYMKKHPDIKQI